MSEERIKIQSLNFAADEEARHYCTLHPHEVVAVFRRGSALFRDCHTCTTIKRRMAMLGYDPWSGMLG